MDHSGNRRSFTQIEAFQFLAKVNSRGLIDSAHRDDIALAQVNFVAVQRENIFFRKPPFQAECQHRLGVLALKGSFGRQVSVLDELLGDARTALADPFVAGVANQGARDAKEIDAVMIEEAAIFNRSDRLYQHRRNVFEC